MNTSILIIAISIVVFFIVSNDLIFAQEQGMDEFLEWPSTDNYNSVIIALVIMIAIGIIANYLWSNRKGRRYSEE